MHSAFSAVVGHETALSVLSHAVAHPAPACLFFGPEGVGKRTVAEAFARALLEIGTESGGPATLDAHPDFVRAQREEGTKEFTIKRARELIARMQLTSARGGRKVALLDEAERLNTEAANALLKAVEEPSGQTVYLFVTSLPDRLPATLRSRLTPIQFQRLPAAQMNALHPHVDPSRERQAAALFEAMTARPIGHALAALESVAKSIEAEEDVEAAWRAHLGQWMELCQTRFADDPAGAVRFANGLLFAWRMVGSSLSPRLALEWSALSPYLIEQQTIDAFYRPRYL